jgi:hypothetical protein
MINDTINILRRCATGAMAPEGEKGKHITAPSITTFSELDSGKNLVIIKNNLIDFF